MLEALAAPASADSHTRSDFDTRIAAINPTAAQASGWNTEQLKNDALWLSQDVAIDELTALRIIILEWQQRPSRVLTSTWSADEIVSLQKNVSGVNAVTIATLKPTSKKTYDETQRDFAAESPRRLRQVELLLRENADRLFVLETLAGSALTCAHLSGIQAASRTMRTRLQDLNKTTSKKLTSLLDPYCECIRSRLDSLSDRSNWPATISADPHLNGLKTVKILQELATLLRLALLAILKLPYVAADEDIIAWFNLMDRTNFLSDLRISDPSQEQPLYIIQALVSIISVALLSVPESLGYLQCRFGAESRELPSDMPARPYLDSEPCIALLTSTLLGAASYNIRHVGPVVLAWSVIAQMLRDLALNADIDGHRSSIDSSDLEGSLSRRSSLRGSVSRSSRPGVLLGQVMDTVPGEDPIALMGNASITQMGAFDSLTAITGILTRCFGTKADSHVPIFCREIFMSLLREVLPLVTYGPDIIEGLLAVLSYDSLGVGSALGREQWPTEPAQSLLDDAEVMGPKLVDQVLKRYPYELGPFMSCLNALSKSSASVEQGESRTMLLLEDLSTFTMVMPHDFKSYELSQEDEVANVIRLTRDVPIFASRSGADRRGSHDGLNTFILSAGTFGTILNDSKPFVICWQYRHSAFEYLGCLLSTRLSNSRLLDGLTGQPVDLETATDILSLFTSILGSLTSTSNNETAKELLGRMSNGLSRNDDVIRVIFELFDGELQAHTQQDPQVSLALLEACVKFMTVIAELYPERIWSFLARSRLLANMDDTNTLSAIVNASEVTLSTYPFLRSCVRLFDGLVRSAVSESSRSTSSKALTRFDDVASMTGTMSEKSMSVVVLAFQRIVTDFLQGMAGWRFTDAEEQIELRVTITNTLTAILDCAFGIEIDSRNMQGLTTVFNPAAKALMAAFLTTDQLAFQAFLDVFLYALLADEDVSLQERHARRSLTCAVVSLCTALLNVAHMLQVDDSALVQQLLEAMPLLARLYASHISIRARLVDLITSLVTALKSTKDVPPSLLSYVSPQATKSFITVLSHVKQPLASLEAEVRTWKMLSAIVSSKQQLLAIYLLTGSSPRDRMVKETDKRETNVLSTALDQLSNLDAIAPRRAKTMLDFVANCQNHWPWASGIIKSHASFIGSITSWLADNKPHTGPTDSEVATRLAHENHMAGSIANILATYLHSISQTEAEKLITELVPKLQHLADHGVDVLSYNVSLHTNLTKNFVQHFPNCALQELKRSALHPMDYGRNYYYNLDRAVKMLGANPSWDRRNGKSFVDEVARASCNFALVDSEIVLLKQWKTLAVEISVRAVTKPDVQKMLAKVIEQCLKANLDSSLPDGLCDDLATHRADLAFALLQRLVTVKSTEPAATALIWPAWNAVRTHNQDFDVISQPKDAAPYRLLLRILYLTLQLQPQADKTGSTKSANSKRVSFVDGKSSAPDKTSTMGATMLDILQRVVVVNFRALCSSVHEDVEMVDSSDFVLLTAIMQSILGSRDVQPLQQQVATIVSEAALIRYATSLYSWSHSLSRTPNASADPLYGLLSVLFLLSLSRNTLCAEEMAVSCVITHLSTAATSTGYFRNPRGGSGPFDQPQRAHEIWARGILPLCLNLLEAVGPAIAGEITAFLNSFPNQLARLERDLAPPHVGGYQKNQIHQATNGRLTLNLASEAHSICLLGIILDRLRSAGASVETSGVRSDEIEVLKCDRSVIKEYLGGLLGPRRDDGSAASAPLQSCLERIVPVGARELQWSRTTTAKKHDHGGSGSEGLSVLEKRVVDELIGAADCLTYL